MKKFILGIVLGILFAVIAVISFNQGKKSSGPAVAQNQVSALDKIRVNRQSPQTDIQENLQHAVDNLLKAKEPKDIITSLDEILKYRPQDANLLALKAQMLQKRGNLPAAFEAINKAIAIDPKNPNYYQIRGELEFNAGDYDKAERNFTAAAQLSGKADNYYNRAVTNLNLGDYEAANEDFKTAQKLYKKEGNLGASIQAQNMSGILSEGLKQAANQNVSNVNNANRNTANTSRATAKQTNSNKAVKISSPRSKKTGNKRTSKKSFSNIFDSKDAPAMDESTMSKISQSLKHVSESETFSDFKELLPKEESAISSFDNTTADIAASDAQPSLEDSIAEQYAKQPKITTKELIKDTTMESLGKAKRLISQKDFDGAKKVLDKAIEKTPDNDSLYYNRAQANFQKGDYKSAFADLNKALDLNPNNYQAALSKGDLYNSLGQSEQAKKAYQEAAHLAAAAGDNKVAEDAKTKYQLLEGKEITARTNQRLAEAANAYYRGDYDRATNLFNQIYQENPNADNAFNLGLAYQGQGKIEEANQMFKEAAKQKPQDLKVQMSVANTAVGMKDYETAREYLGKALEIDDSNPDLWALSAQINNDEQKYSDAKHDAEKSLSGYEQMLGTVQDNAERERIEQQIQRLNEYLEQLNQAGIN